MATVKEHVEVEGHVKVTFSADESSDSDTDNDIGLCKGFQRRISTNKELNTTRCLKEGYLQKHIHSSLPRWRRRYFKLKSKHLYYAKNANSALFEQIDLTDVSVAETSIKNIKHGFKVITPGRHLELCAESRRDMEEWISCLKATTANQFVEPGFEHQVQMTGMHNWYISSHARPTYCNVCREALSGVMSKGLSCEVCKFRCHKKCASRAVSGCKWTTMATMGSNIIETDDRQVLTPHQWLEGNLPLSVRCVVCERGCGSVLRLSDFRCLWCKVTIHGSCRERYRTVCPLGPCRVSILPPTAINSTDENGYWQATSCPGTSPLLVFINSKSGSSQGVRFLRRLKHLLNPAQVFDLIAGGPKHGLRMFSKFPTFRVLVCGGDGSVGWVFTEIDQLGLNKQCQVGVLPLGTGNDLSRVLGWGASMDDDQQLPQMLQKLEQAQIKMLDRWSILTYEGTMPQPRKVSQQFDPISLYEDSVAVHLSKILHSNKHSDVLSSAKVLCQTVKDFVTKVGRALKSEDVGSPNSASSATSSSQRSNSITAKCDVLQEKLESLLNTLNAESHQLDDNNEVQDDEPGDLPRRQEMHASREAVMLRANSLKKAVRKIIEHTERAVDENLELTSDLGVFAPPSPPVSPTEPHIPILQLPLFTAAPTDPASTPSSPTNETTVPIHVSDISSSSGAPAIKNSRRELDSSLSQSAPMLSALGSEEESSAQLAGGISPASLSQQLELQSQSAHTSPSRRRYSRVATSRTGCRRITNMSAVAKSASFSSLSKSVGLLSSSSASRLPLIPPKILGKRSGVGAVSGTGLVSRALLINADTLCAAVSPLPEEDIPLDDFEEKVVMNNYFGIGLDAKIMLDFHHKRENHPEKCRSRTKNRMWFTVLAGREILSSTHRNLDQRISLECDGQRLPLPALQGVVVLNIPSFAGGTNFWGGSKSDTFFQAPSFDDRLLEVVAVFGTAQLAVSRVVNLQYHRIAQCRSVKITILGDDTGVPIQVDGEAWLQPPGYIRIEHKNRAPVLTHDRVFASTLRSWTARQQQQCPDDVTADRLMEARPRGDEASSSSDASLSHLCDTVQSVVSSLAEMKPRLRDEPQWELIDTLIARLKSELSPLVDATDENNPSVQAALCSRLSELVKNVQLLQQELTTLIERISPEKYDLEVRTLRELVSQLQVSMQQIHEPANSADCMLSNTSTQTFDKAAKRWRLGRFKKHKHRRSRDASLPTLNQVLHWTTGEVLGLLEELELNEYRNVFSHNDISGAELVALDKRDLKDMGVTKLGHQKRILNFIKVINAQK